MMFKVKDAMSATSGSTVVDGGTKCDRCSLEWSLAHTFEHSGIQVEVNDVVQALRNAGSTRTTRAS
jgi:hypothetical protein